jgi:hypothetical protein
MVIESIWKAGDVSPAGGVSDPEKPGGIPIGRVK